MSAPATSDPPSTAQVPSAGRRQKIGSVRSRLAQRVALLSERLARSSRIFLLGLLVACGVEVVVDWNSTLFEINVLRDGMRQRGENYARILANTSVDLMLAYDTEALDRLCDGMFHDDDVIFIRFTDQQGAIMLDRVNDHYATEFAKRRKSPFRDYYAIQMQRDITGILAEPELLAQRMASSRHRDFVQAWNDGVKALKDRFLGPPLPEPRKGGVVLYQDRLKQKKGGHDSEVTYALSTLIDDRGEDLGVVLVAFSVDRLNAQIEKKYLKGLGMVVFFVGLILIQSTLSRREKLRKLELQARQQLAKQALREALPGGPGETIQLGEFKVSGGLLQSTGTVDGVAWDLLLPKDLGGRNELLLLAVDPDGEGVSAVATSLHVLRTFRKRCAGGPISDLASEVAELGAAAMTIPLTRPIHVWLLRIDLETGALSGVCGPLGAARVLMPGAGRNGGTITALSETLIGSGEETPLGLIGPLYGLAGELLPGATLCGVFNGVMRLQERRDSDIQGLAEYILRSRRGRTELGAVAADASIWARGRLAAATGDVLVVLASRQSA